MNGIGLTAKQRSLKQFITSYFEANGIAPSFDEMRTAMGLKSKSGIHRMMQQLIERGHLKRIGGRARAISVVDGGTAIDTADALRVVLDRCKMSREASQEIARLLAAEIEGAH